MNLLVLAGQALSMLTGAGAIIDQVTAGIAAHKAAGRTDSLAELEAMLTMAEAARHEASAKLDAALRAIAG